MNRPFIVGEISGNHLGSFERAQDLVDAAANAGADAVKFQCFTPEQMAPKDALFYGGPWDGQQAIAVYGQTWTPKDWFKPLFDHAKVRGLVAFSSVFHPDDVAFLETLGCPIYKISSFELTDLNLIASAAATGKQLIISTGMGTEYEIHAAWNTCLAYHRNMTFLKCTSAYPAPIEEANLATMQYMAESMWCAVGVSDHTMGHAVAVAATALGATVIEKHLTLSRSDGGPDAAFSAEPEEFAQMVKACREAALAIGTVHYGPTPSEMSNLPLRRQPGGMRGMRGMR